MLLSSYSDLLVDGFFTKGKSINPLCDFYMWKQKIAFAQTDSHAISFPTCHAHLFVTKAASYDWSLYVCNIKILPEGFVTFIVLLHYLSELRIYLWFLLKLGSVKNFTYLEVFWNTRLLSASFTLWRCFICCVLLVSCLLTSELCSFFRAYYCLGTVVLVLYPNDTTIWILNNPQGHTS